MRTWQQLTADEQQRATVLATGDILQFLEHIDIWDYPGDDDIQRRAAAAYREMETMQTPWFYLERLQEDSVCKAWIDDLVQERAHDALYPDDGEYVIYLT